RAFSNLWDAVNNRGRFSDKNPGEIALELFKAQTPVTRTQGAYLVAVGQRDPKQDLAVKKYFEWVKANKPQQANYPDKIGYDAFRRANREIYDALKRGDKKAANEALSRAFDAGEIKHGDRKKGAQYSRQAILS